MGKTRASLAAGRGLRHHGPITASSRLRDEGRSVAAQGDLVGELVVLAGHRFEGHLGVVAARLLGHLAEVGRALAITLGVRLGRFLLTHLTPHGTPYGPR